MRRAAIKVGAKSAKRGSTFRAKPRGLERRGELAAMSEKRRRQIEASGKPMPCSSLKQSASKRRPPTEAEIAREWHGLNTRGRLCVKCGRPAGPWAHHIVPQQFLKDWGLHAHLWDHENAAPVDNDCHMNHEAKGVNEANPITRAELHAAGRWEQAVEWAQRLDAEYFPDGHEPVLARLLRDYPNTNERS
ncbi:MAG TPA: hypothetical protein VFS37_08995 [Conexibacter sp.]|nr:hypothetical protein [Conexibacter sp.]